MVGKWSRFSLTSENLGMYEDIFENVHIVDSHTHIGKDKDGMSITADRLVKWMKRANINKCVAFPLNDPRAGTDFNIPNDEILLASKVYKERIVPFFRLNPNGAWKTEFNLRMEQGFKGLKLHPRSQNFKINAKKMQPIYKECVEHDIPIVMHTGLGLEGIAEDFNKILKANPKLKLILGHAGFVDLDNVIKLLGKKDNVMLETSTLRVFDLYEVLKNVDYKKIAFGSDAPYYDIDWALQGLVDTAISLGKTANQIRKMMGGNILKWVQKR